MNNKHILPFPAILFLILGLSSCQKAPELSITGPTSVEIIADGGSSSITFTTNRDWAVTWSESWISVSPSSGSASDVPVTVSIRCNPNTTYEDRSGTVTIKAEDLTQTINVRQPANLGLIVPTRSYDIQSGAKTIEVEVQSNVHYSVAVSVDWIKQTGTKGLMTDRLVFSVEENQSYDSREGSITIKPLNGNVSQQVISVRQAQKDALNVKNTSYNVPYGGGEIEVKVESSVEFDVTPNVDWIHYVSTKALSNSTVCLTIDENTTYSTREGKIELKQKNGSLSHTITVKQAGRIAVTSITLNKTSLSLKEGETETLVATVKPNNATDKTVTWTSSNSSVATVDEGGHVTAIKAGSATINAIINTVSASCSLVVRTKEVIPESGIDLGYVFTRDDGSMYRLYWAEWNLGASCPEEYGDYYAWGETETYYLSQNPLIWKQGKETGYDWSSYKFNPSGDGVTMTKYISDSDTSVRLESIDDAATVNWGKPWRMPTKEEIMILSNKELFSNKYDEAKKGCIITSTIPGYEDKSIFFPFAGVFGGTKLERDQYAGYYWSSDSGFGKNGAEGLYVSMEYFSSGGSQRNMGWVIRPVYEEKVDRVPVSSVALNKTELTLVIGGHEYLEATISPSNATDKSVSWSSSNSAVALVNYDGEVIGNSVGSATITAEAEGKTATCYVTVKKPAVEAVDLGLSVKWASINLGATSREGAGEYYAWGELETKDEYTYANYRWACGNSKFSKYCTIEESWGAWGGEGHPDGKTMLDLEDDVAHLCLGDKWHIPSKAEWDELLSLCTWTWTDVNDKNGYEVRSNINGNSIFLPVTGSVNNSNYTDTGSRGQYWSSSLEEATEGIFALGFIYSSAHVSSIKRFVGIPIRPVYGDYTTETVAVTSVSLNQTSLTLNAGESYSLEATVKPDNATNKTVSWSSSDTSIATVDFNGKVSAITAGAATITARAGEKTATCVITVTTKDTHIQVESVSLNKNSLTLTEGESETLKATVKPDNATDKTVIWNTSNSNVVIVDDNGKVSAIKEGSATITAKAGERTATCSITVKAKDIPPATIPVESITLNKKSISLAVGETETLIATITPGNATDKTVTWSSSNSSVATVDANGTIKAVGIGSANITAVAGEKTAACSVSVINKEDNIVFADPWIKAALVEKFDLNGDGELSYSEAAAVSKISNVFRKDIAYTSFDEFQYFTSVKSFGAIFRGWEKLTSITLPPSISTIEAYAFNKCKSLTSITLPENLTYISRCAFYQCTSLKSIQLPAGLKTIGYYAFRDCTSLTTIIIPNSVTTIEELAFADCSSLVSITFPEGLTSIYSSLLENCSSLTSIIIPQSVASIGYRALFGCVNLTEIKVLPTSPPSLGDNAFDNTKDCPIRVPKESVEKYRNRVKWTTYANRIQAL